MAPELLLARMSSVVAWNDCVDSEQLRFCGVRGRDCFAANKSPFLFYWLGWWLNDCRQWCGRIMGLFTAWRSVAYAPECSSVCELSGY